MQLFQQLQCLPLHLSRFHSFFFNDPATTEIYTLSLHDALPIFSGSGTYQARSVRRSTKRSCSPIPQFARGWIAQWQPRSEEHTSELQSRENLVCRLLLEKKKNPEKRPEGATTNREQRVKGTLST